jgi:hypothetical protein
MIADWVMISLNSAQSSISDVCHPSNILIYFGNKEELLDPCDSRRHRVLMLQGVPEGSYVADETNGRRGVWVGKMNDVSFTYIELLVSTI